MEFEAARERAIKYIALSKKTKMEVVNKLKSLGCDESVAYKVAEYYENLGYIDDKDYVKSYVRQNEKMLKYSIIELEMKLKQKGINEETYEKELQSLKESSYEEKIKDKLMSSKLKNMDELKAKAYLYRRGFKI